MPNSPRPSESCRDTIGGYEILPYALGDPTRSRRSVPCAEMVSKHRNTGLVPVDLATDLLEIHRTAKHCVVIRHQGEENRYTYKRAVCQ